MSVSESVNIEVLRERFPSEVLNPYGEVLVIPSRLFQRGWEQDLEAQGYRVFANDYQGEAAFFVRINKTEPKATHVTKPNTGRRSWTSQEEERLREMVERGMGNLEIAKDLGRTKYSIVGKVARMGLTQQRSSPPPRAPPQPPGFGPGNLNPEQTIRPQGEDYFKALLNATLDLYPGHRYVCGLLLSKAQKLLREEK